MRRVYVVGSLNMDITIHATEIPKSGETVKGWGFRLSPGGKGANQAVACALLGGDVSMHGCVGKDIYGDSLKANLIRHGADSSHVLSLGDVSTGTAVIIVCNADNRIIINSGANGRFSSSMCSEIHFDENDILILQLEIPFYECMDVLARASTAKAKIIFNPAPAVEFDKSILSKVDVLILNETEAYSITSIYPDTLHIEEALTALKKLGAKSVILTLGDKGSVYCNSAGIVEYFDAFRVNAIDTTAAGDTFIGAFGARVAEGWEYRDAIRFAQAASALAVTKPGAQDSMPGISEVYDFLDINKETNNYIRES